MTTHPLPRRVATAAIALTVAACGLAASSSAPATAADGCGIQLLPSLDPTGTHPGGELLDLSSDGVYVGISQDSDGVFRPTYWVGGLAHPIPVQLAEGFLYDVNEHHVTVGDGYDEGLGRWRSYVFDIDSGTLTWLPGIGGEWAGARRINDHGVAVGDGVSRNGTAHPLRWSAPYTVAELLPRVGGTGDGSSAWAAGNNNRGDVVGVTNRGRLTPDRRDYGGLDAREHDSDIDAVAWTPKVLSLQEAGPASLAFDVNDDRRAVGFADLAEIEAPVAAYWSLDDRRLHHMGEPVAGMWASIALGVSEGGWATGSVEMPGEDRPLRHAFVWTGSGDLKMLPTLEGDWTQSTSNAHGVDDARDEVAGMLWTGVGEHSQPTVWHCASAIGREAS